MSNPTVSLHADRSCWTIGPGRPSPISRLSTTVTGSTQGVVLEKKRFVGGVHVIGLQVLLHQGNLKLLRQVEHHPPGDSLQDVSVPRCADHSIGDQEYVIARAFGQVAFGVREDRPAPPGPRPPLPGRQD